MAAPLQNKFWMRRSTHGRDRLFASSDALWAACLEYFEDVAANPLKEEKAFQYQGAIVTHVIDKMQAMTLTGLYIFLDIDETTWRDWRSVEDFSKVVAKVERIIYTQKFTGAAADMLNPNIIARDLKLRDAVDTNHSGTLSVEMDYSHLNDDELALVRATLATAMARKAKTSEPKPEESPSDTDHHE